MFLSWWKRREFWTLLEQIESYNNMADSQAQDESSTGMSPGPAQFYTVAYLNLHFPWKLEITSGALVNNWRRFKRVWILKYKIAA